MWKMKRSIIMTLIVVVCFLLETIVFQRLSISTIVPNLMIIVTASFGVMRGKRTGMLTGFFSGLLIDLFFGELLGFYALIYMLLGYANGYFKRIFYPEDVKLPLFLVGASDLILSHLIYLFHFVMRSRFHYGYYLGTIMIPELIYTMLITLLLYPVILKTNQKLEEQEKRSASKFV